MVSAAARHCLVLGYHREGILKRCTPEESEKQRHLFWALYTLDKNLALTLGRTPTLQDYDIDAQLCTASSDPAFAPWDKIFISWILLAQLQGDIYDKLYSSSALSVDTETRTRRIAELSSRCSKWYDDWRQLPKDHSAALYPDHIEKHYGPSDLIYYSVLTSLHRADAVSDSATEITAPCFEAARRSLEAHLRWFPRFAEVDALVLSGYVAW